MLKCAGRFCIIGLWQQEFRSQRHIPHQRSWYIYSKQELWLFSKPKLKLGDEEFKEISDKVYGELKKL